jgi:hypothetical protein
MADAVEVRIAQEQAAGDLILVSRELFEQYAMSNAVQFNVAEMIRAPKPGEKDSDALGRLTAHHRSRRLRPSSGSSTCTATAT